VSGVLWSVRSRQDLRSAFDYYRRIDDELALPIVEAVEAKAAWLAEFPGTGSPTALGLRKSLVAETPYLIAYRETSRGIEVSRVHHTAQDWRL